MKYKITDNAPEELGKAGEDISLTKTQAEQMLLKGYVSEISNEPELPLTPAPTETKPPVVEGNKKGATGDGARA